MLSRKDVIKWAITTEKDPSQQDNVASQTVPQRCHPSVGEGIQGRMQVRAEWREVMQLIKKRRQERQGGQQELPASQLGKGRYPESAVGGEGKSTNEICAWPQLQFLPGRTCTTLSKCAPSSVPLQSESEASGVFLKGVDSSRPTRDLSE